MQEEALIHFLRENDLTLMFAVVEPQTTRYTGCNPGEEGAYLIGARGKNPDDQPVSQAQLDAFAKELKLRRPKWARMPFQQVKARLATSRSLDGKHCIEGYVVHKDTPEQVALFKMKTPAFLASKLLTNLADGRIKFMYANPAAFKSEVHPEVHPLVDKLTSRTNRDAFLKMPAAERKALASSVV